MTRRPQPRVSQVRLSIRKAVEEHPGIHFRGLARAAQVTSAGQLRHHLDKLERAGDVVEVEDGRYRRFFVAGQHEPKVRAEMARFSRAVPRRIARLLLDRPMNRTQLRRSLRCADSTLGYHLSRMVMLGDLARLRGPQSCVYSLAREDEVRRMLLAQGVDDDPALDPPSKAPPEDLRGGRRPEAAQQRHGLPGPPGSLPFPDRASGQPPDGARTPFSDAGGPDPSGPRGREDAWASGDRREDGRDDERRRTGPA